MKVDTSLLDEARLHQLFDLRSPVYASRGGTFDVDPYPAFHRLRQSGPVHEGVVGPLVGYTGDGFFQGLPFPERPHFSAFDFATCDAALRDPATFSSSPAAGLPAPVGNDDGLALYEASMISLDADAHRRLRGLVQPSFVPRRMQWWLDRWIAGTVDSLLDRFADRRQADLNVELFAPIPLLTICGSFGVSVAEALDIRAAATSDGLGLGRFFAIVEPLIAARRLEPQDDLISVLVQAELLDDDRARHVLSDAEVLSFAFLLLAAGSGTTWKQMGITMHALLTHPEWLARVRAEPATMRPVIEESLRWNATDPMFSRFVTRDVTLGGVDVPAGAVLHLCLGAANRDPARWERPDEFDPSRSPQPHLGFGNGPHICLGMHVARTEITAAVTAAVTRLPGLRLDADRPAPQLIGMYERGPDALPVVWDR